MSENRSTGLRWYQARGREKAGPFTLEELHKLAGSGQLSPSDMLLEDGASRWVPARDTDGLFNPSVPATRAPPIEPAIPRTLSVPPPTRATESGPETLKETGPDLSRGQAPLAGYEILEELGRGGMGVVYKARQIKLDRVVALKVILAGVHAGDAERARFQTEAEAIARLQHPNIIQIYEVGEWQTEGGGIPTPYFSLEFCSGGSLAHRLAGTPLPPREAAELVETLAQAIHAAHQAGIIHRDLKPANVLLAGRTSPASGVSNDPVEERPGSPPTALDGLTPKITDFGLARKLDEDNLTRPGAILGTPSYMAPEQAAGETSAIGPAADVYALGATLYECLTGRPPFKGATMMDTLVQVRSREPVPPRQLAPGVPRDLEVICLKCLQKETHKRYTTGGELADDLTRFLRGEPILARPVGRLERTWRWGKRNPALATVVILLALSLTAGVSGIAIKWREAVAHYDEMVVQRDLADENAEEANQKRIEANDNRKLAEARELKNRRFAYASFMDGTAEAWKRGDLASMERLLSVFVPREDEKEDLRGFEWHYYWNLLRGSRLTLHGHAASVNALAFSPDGRLLASGGRDTTVRLWDAQTGAERGTIRMPSEIKELAFSPDGKRLAVVCVTRDLFLIDIGGSKPRHSIGNVFTATFAPDGKALVLGRPGGAIEFRDPEGKKVLFTLPTAHKGHVSSIRFGARGDRMVSCGGDGVIRVWGIDGNLKADGVRLLQASANPPVNPTVKPAVDQFANRIVTGASDGSIQDWFGLDREKTPLTARIIKSSPGLAALALSSRSSTLAFVGKDRTVRVWDLITHQELTPLGIHPLPVRAVAVSPDGKQLATAGDDGSVRVWDLKEAPRKARSGRVNAVAFSPTEDLLATAGDDGTARVWNARTGKEEARLETDLDPPIQALVFTPDGKQVIVGDDDGRHHFWDLAARKSTSFFNDQSEPITSLAVSPDGRWLATGTENGTLSVLDLRSRKRHSKTPANYQRIVALAFSPDSRKLATGSWDSIISVYDLQEKRQLARFNHFSRILSVAFTADGENVLASTGASSVFLLSVAKARSVLSRSLTGTPVALVPAQDRKGLYLAMQYAETARVVVWDDVLSPPEKTPRSHIVLPAVPVAAALARDGKQLAVGGEDGTVALWDAGKKTVERVLPAHTRGVAALASSPDGTTLARAAADFTVRILDSATQQERLALRGHTHVITSVSFSPDGKTVASAAHDQTIRLWDVASGQARATWQSPDSAVRSLAFSPDGRTLATGNRRKKAPVELWDVASGQVRHSLDGHRWAVRGVVFVSRGNLLATVSGDEYEFPGEIKLWDVASGKEVASRLGHRTAIRAVAASPDGRSLATAGTDGLVRLWDVSDSRTLLRPLHVFSGHVEAVRALAFSPDGRTLVSAGKDASLHYWQPVTGLPLGTVPMPATVRCLAFNPAGTTLFAGEADRSITTYPAAPVKELDREGPGRAGTAGSAVDLSAESERLLASTKRRLAARFLEDGAWQSAADQLRAAADILAKLAPRYPDPALCERECADALLALADLLRTHDNAAAETVCVAAEAALQRLAALLPRADDFRLLRGRLLRIRAGILHTRNRSDEAARCYQEAFELLDTGMDAREIDSAVSEELVHLILDRLPTLDAVDEKTERKVILNTAISCLERLLKQQRVRPRYWEQFATLLETRVGLLKDNPGERIRTLNRLVWVLELRSHYFVNTVQQKAQLEQALRLRKEAWEGGHDVAPLMFFPRMIAYWEKGQSSEPEKAEPWSEAAEYREYLGYVLLKQGKFSEAKALAHKAIREQQSAINKAPANGHLRGLLASHHVLLIAACWKQGEHDEAAAEAVKWLAVRPETAERCVTTARSLSNCVRLAEGDPKLSPERQKLKAREYADQMMYYLDRAVRQGYKNVAELEKGELFKPLRGRDDFKKLLDRIKKET